MNKKLLAESVAGMRLIAFMTLLNGAQFARLKEYVGSYFHPTLLEEQSVSAWVALLKAQYRLAGKLKVKQVIATDKHQAIVVMLGSIADAVKIVNLVVEDEYPHRVTRFDVADG
jgi:hypothetical protein